MTGQGVAENQAREDQAKQNRIKRRAQEQLSARAAILDAARRVGSRDGARLLSLRNVAAEAGFAPAALYGYFRSKDELILALAAEDLTHLARQIRDAAATAPSGKQNFNAISAALDMLQHSETLATAPSALKTGEPSEADRLFNGRLIASLKALSEGAGIKMQDRTAQIDTLLLAATLSGLAMLKRTGRLTALGFTQDELIARLADKT